MNLLIHSGYLYSTSPSPLLLRGAPDTARILCRNFTPKRHRQLSEGLVQGPYVAAKVGVEPLTLRMEGVDSTNVPPMPTYAVIRKQLSVKDIHNEGEGQCRQGEEVMTSSIVCI